MFKNLVSPTESLKHRKQNFWDIYVCLLWYKMENVFINLFNNMC
jgi:hypothetical protein